MRAICVVAGLAPGGASAAAAAAQQQQGGPERVRVRMHVFNGVLSLELEVTCDPPEGSFAGAAGRRGSKAGGLVAGAGSANARRRTLNGNSSTAGSGAVTARDRSAGRSRPGAAQREEPSGARTARGGGKSPRRGSTVGSASRNGRGRGASAGAGGLELTPEEQVRRVVCRAAFLWCPRACSVAM